MPNIANALKAEISRVARKEVRLEVEPLRKALTAHRVELAALKRRALVLEQELKKARKGSSKVLTEHADEATPRTRRFSAKTLQSQRRRLGLSAEEVGLLVGASGQSVYNWESGNATPRQKHMAALSALKELGKKTAASHLETLRQNG
jgi:DNA-binding transcriptional regulator YiaG